MSELNSMKIGPTRMARDRTLPPCSEYAPRPADVLDAMRAFSESSRDRDSLARTIAERTAWLFGDGCLLLQHSEDRRTLVPTAVHFHDPELLDRASFALGMESHSIERRFDSPAPEPLDGPRRTAGVNPALPPECAALLADLSAHRVILAPLRGAAQEIGLLVVVRLTGGEEFSNRETEMLRAISEHATMALQLARLREVLGA